MLVAAVVDRIDKHRDTQRVRDQDELLSLVRAHLACPGQKVDGGAPLVLGQLDLVHKGVQVADQGLHDPPKARRTFLVVDPGDDRVHRVLFRQIVCHATSSVAAGPMPGGDLRYQGAFLSRRPQAAG